jgi:hypothetical protein
MSMSEERLALPNLLEEIEKFRASPARELIIGGYLLHKINPWKIPNSPLKKVWLRQGGGEDRVLVTPIQSGPTDSD